MRLCCVSALMSMSEECSSHTTRVYFKTNDKSRKSTVVCVRQTDHQTCSKKLLTVRSLKAKMKIY